MDEADADDTTPDAARYPALGEMPHHRHLTACETLCWFGYGRAIPRAVYYGPTSLAPAIPYAEIHPLLHRSVPDPKPIQCPMDDAERALMEKLRARAFPALNKNKDGSFDVVPDKTYEFAVVVSTMGGFAEDTGAPCRDRDLAGDYLARRPSLAEVFFRTSDVLQLLPAWPVGAAGLPTGLVPLARIGDFLREREAAWKLTLLSSTGFHPRWRLLTNADGAIGDALIDGTPRAVGRTVDGRLFWIRAHVWSNEGSVTSLLRDVLVLGTWVWIEDDRGTRVQVQPLIAMRGLALVFGSGNPPDAPPPGVLSAIVDPEASPTTTTPAAPLLVEKTVTLTDWTERQARKTDEAATPVKAEVPPPMRPIPVPPAELLRWWLPYMAEHPDPDRRPTVAEQHAAAIKHFVGRKPPTTIDMRRLRELPQTPPEWREPGRRPKSR